MLDVLRPAARQAEGELPVAHVNSRFVHGHLLPVVIVIEPRHQLAGFHGHALLHRQIDNAAGHLEADQTLVGFNVARKLEDVFHGGLAEPLGMEVDHCATNRQ